MATLRASIALYDGVTGPLRHMAAAMNVVLNSFESLQTASGSAVDTAAIREGREQFARFSTELDGVESNLRNVNSQQQRLNGSLARGARASEGLISGLGRIGAAAASYMGIRQGFRLSDVYASTNARLGMLTEDEESRKALEQGIMASAQRSRAAYFDTADAVAKLGLNAGGAFSGNDEIIAFMEQVNKQYAIGGATAQGQSAAMLQLTQAMASGALRGEELNSILENAPGIARAVERYMSIGEGSIKQYAQQGQITAEVVKNALFAAAEETNAKFESMPKTWAQVWTSMQNRALGAFTPILQRIGELANDERTGHILDGLIGALGAAAGMLGYVLELAVAFGGAIYDNWDILGPLILGIAAALGVYAAGLAIVNGMEAAGTAIKLAATAAAYAKAAVTRGAVTATMAETAAQLGLNTALLACPITWIILAIIALIAVIYAAVGAVNHFSGTSISATGVIAGVFASLAAVIGNHLIYLWNAFAEFGNFIVNVFRDPVAAIEMLFLNMSMNVIGFIRNMAAAIERLLSAIPGVSVNITGTLDDIYGALEQKAQQVRGGSDWVEVFERKEYIDYGDAYASGYQFGQGIDNRVSGLFSMDGLDAFGFGSSLDGIYAAAGDTAYNTAAMADEMDIAQENLAYMRDIAEREAINRYTTAQVTIHQTNENHISSQMDLDGVMEALGTGLAEQMEISREGL